jgi:mono/diheme cytochrome c family protein
MQQTPVRLAFVVMAAVALGCAPAATLSDDGGPDTGGGDIAVAVTYTKDVQPIFMAKCATCHTGDGSGGHNIGTTYADAFKLVMTTDAPAGCFKDGDAKTMPKTIGECTLPAIMEGWMPMSMGCFNTPRPDPCVTLAQQDVVAAWIAAGMPQ